MNTNDWERQFYEYLFGRAEYPQLDTLTVPYPINFTPIPVTYIPSEEIIEVRVK